PRREAVDTSHFSVLDVDGNRVAATLSINYSFGSGFMVPGTGVLLNDEMDDFSMSPDVPNVYGLVGGRANAIAPGKRPLSSMTPTFIETRERVAILGTPGGSRIISMVLLGVLEFARGNGPYNWVSRPRFHHQYLPDRVEYEPGALDERERDGLRSRGHTLVELGGPYGNMQAVLWDRRLGVVRAAADPRGEGRARVGVSPHSSPPPCCGRRSARSGGPSRDGQR
ncbi:MAG: gamma-glutamyltransferase, partial [Gammaproteobacteria bacterium]